MERDVTSRVVAVVALHRRETRGQNPHLLLFSPRRSPSTGRSVTVKCSFILIPHGIISTSIVAPSADTTDLLHASPFRLFKTRLHGLYGDDKNVRHLTNKVRSFRHCCLLFCTNGDRCDVTARILFLSFASDKNFESFELVIETNIRTLIETKTDRHIYTLHR